MAATDIFAPLPPRALRALSSDGRVELDESEHTYWRGAERWPGVNEVMRDRGIVDVSWFNETAALRGSLVHRAVQLALLGTLDWRRLDARLEPYVQGALKALRALRAETIAVEELVYSGPMRGAGRPDWRGHILSRARQGFIDWTTLKTIGARPANLEGKRFQMATYREMMLDMTGVVVVDRYTVALYPNADYNTFSHREVGDGPRMRREFAEWWKERQYAAAH